MKTNCTPADILAATPTGHEMSMCAAGIAARLESWGFNVTAASVASHLGRLRSAGLVERDRESAEWSRYDSQAPGLDAAQAEALDSAERARPSREQFERLENFGPALPGQNVPGLSPRDDLDSDLAEVVATGQRNAPSHLATLAHRAARAGYLFRAADLFRMAGRASAGRVRRAGYEERADALEAEARARGPVTRSVEADTPTEAESPVLDAPSAPEADSLAIDAPVILNGFPVVFSARKNGTPARFTAPREADESWWVVVRRDSDFQPYVVASWWPDLGSVWMWGHYLDTPQDVADFLTAEGVALTWGDVAPMIRDERDRRAYA